MDNANIHSAVNNDEVRANKVISLLIFWKNINTVNYKIIHLGIRRKGHTFRPGGCKTDSVEGQGVLTM